MLAATGSSGLPVVIFSDSHFHLAPLGDKIVHYQERLAACSPEIQDLITVDVISHLPMPQLPPYFTGLCLRYFESNGSMARISAEQLVEGMQLDDEWICINLSNAPSRLRQLATEIVAERSFPYDGFLDTGASGSAGETGDLRMIPGSGYQ